MDMEMHAIEVTGTLLGHAVLGSVIVAWGLFWLVDWLRHGEPVAAFPLEGTAVLPVFKIVAPLTIAWFEVPNSGWQPSHQVLGWQHITMYVAFALSGVVDLLARRGVVSARAGHAAYAAAMVNAGFLFLGHGAHGGVPGVAHVLLAILFFVAPLVALAELVRPDAGLQWFRVGALLGIGGWLLTISWILYLAGWDFADPVRVSWTYLFFSWNALVVTVFVTGVRLLSARRRMVAA